jgi:hypothetical protein
LKSGVPLNFCLILSRESGGLHMHKLAKILAYYHRL